HRSAHTVHQGCDHHGGLARRHVLPERRGTDHRDDLARPAVYAELYGHCGPRDCVQRADVLRGSERANGHRNPAHGHRCGRTALRPDIAHASRRRHPVKRASGSRQLGLILLPVVIALSLIAVIAVLLNRDNGMNLTLAARNLQADAARYVAEAGLAQMNYRVQGANCAGYPTLTSVAFGSDRFDASATPTSGTPVTLTATSTTAAG